MRACWQVGRTLLRLGLVDDGAAVLGEALALGDVLFGSGGSGRQQGPPPAWPGRASVLHGLGSAHGMNGEPDRAIARFREALQAEPGSPNAAATRFLLARALAEQGHEAAALDELDAAVRAGLWVSGPLLKGSAFDELQDHPRFISIKERMAKNHNRP